MDDAQPLLFKIAYALWGAIDGSFGLLVRGNVNATSAKGATVARAGFTGGGLASSQTLLAANATRVQFTIDNRSGGDLFYRYGAVAATATPAGYDVHVLNNTSYTDASWAGQVTFICSASSGAGVNVTDVSV
jgi:hypothetical protein